MTKATRCKYIALFVHLVVICLSLFILAALYLFSSLDHNGEGGGSEELSQSFTSESTLGTNRSIVHRKPGEEDWQKEEKGKNNSKLYAYLQKCINWLGQSVTSSSGEEANSNTSLFSSGRPLIAVAFLSYMLAIVGSIAIGLEHLMLLFILVFILTFIFASSLSALVITVLTSTFDSNLVIFDFWNFLFLAICSISGIQVCVY